MAEREVEPSARTSYLQSVADRREKAAAAGANFWVFEQADVAGHFLEFVEAGSSDALMLAVAEVGANGADVSQIAPVWREVTGG